MNDQSGSEVSRVRSNSFGRFLGVLWLGLRSRPGLFAAVCVVLVLAGFYGEEDWRGARAWKRYQAEAAARGLSLDYATYIPKPVPDEENFAATPYLKMFMHPGAVVLAKDAYDYPHGAVTPRVEPWRGEPEPGGMGHRHFMHLTVWHAPETSLETNGTRILSASRPGLTARAIAANSVLEGMKPNAEMFAQLRVASRRKHGRFPVEYNVAKPWETLEPHLAQIRDVCGHLQLQACAELAAGRVGDALADVKVMLALADSIREEPSLYSYLIRIPCVRFAIQSMWEGLAEHRWNESQLQELQARFLSCNFVADMDRALEAERAEGVLQCNEIGKDGFGTAGWLFPSGWCGLEKVNFNRGLDKMEGAFDPLRKTVSPQRWDAIAREYRQLPAVEGSGTAPRAVMDHQIVAASRLPALERLPVLTAQAQVEADQAAMACALERYRLANGQFPDTLQALTPRFINNLPNDVITGQPYKYRRTADGWFVLYSVGWNEKDDGGVPGDTLFDTEKGDWVWEYPGL